MTAIFKKEIRTYFTTLTAYIFLGFFVLINAYFFSNINIGGGSPNYGDTLVYTLSIFLILIPIMTMRLFAEESKQKTDQLLYTSPISVTQIVLGKFFAAVFLYFIGIVIISVFPIILGFYSNGSVSPAETFSCFLGYFLLGVGLIAIGIFVSSLTDNQIIAAVSTFAAVFFILMMDGIIEKMPIDTLSSIIFLIAVILLISFLFCYGTKNKLTIIFALVFGILAVAAVIAAYIYDNLIFDGVIIKTLGWFSMLSRFEGFYMGMFSLSDFIYFITFSAVFLYLTVNTIERKRWS